MRETIPAYPKCKIWHCILVVYCCYTPRFPFNVEQLASIYHQSERGKRYIPAEYVRISQNMDIKSLTKLHLYAMTSVSMYRKRFI